MKKKPVGHNEAETEFGRPAKDTEIVWRLPEGSAFKNEFVTASAIVAGASLVYGVGKDLIPRLKNHEQPLIIRMLESHTIEGGRKEISFSVSNFTLHGIYIERIRIKKPGIESPAFLCRTMGQYQSKATSTMGLGQEELPKLKVDPNGEAEASKLIEPNSSIAITIDFKSLDEKAEKAEIGITYTDLVGSKKGIEISAVITLR